MEKVELNTQEKAYLELSLKLANAESRIKEANKILDATWELPMMGASFARASAIKAAQAALATSESQPTQKEES